MAKCYYCGDEVTNDDLTEVDGQWIRVCADCWKFIGNYGTEDLEHACGDRNKAIGIKHYIELINSQPILTVDDGICKIRYEVDKSKKKS